MATAAQRKLCKVCGTDVSQAKRTKDAAGNYYCDRCARAAQQSATVPGSRNSQQSNRICANCGKALGALEQGTLWQNHRVCVRCIDILQSEQAEMKHAAEEAASETSRQAEQERQAHASRRAVLSRAFWGQFRAVVGIASCGAITAAAGWLMLATPKHDDFGQASPSGSLLAFAAFFGILTLVFIFRFRRFGKHLAAGDNEAILRQPGLPFSVGLPIATGLSLIGLAVGVFLGLLAAELIGDTSAFKTVSDPSGSIVWWVCIPIGTLLGLVAAGAIWEQFRLSQCPNCRQYGVVAVLGSEHAGTTFSTYNTMERVVTKGIDGQILATSNVPTQRLETTETRRQFCRCRNCGHEWARLRSWTSR